MRKREGCQAVSLLRGCADEPAPPQRVDERCGEMVGRFRVPRLLDGLERDERAPAAQPRHHARLRQHPLVGFGGGVGDDGVRGEEGARCVEVRGRLEVLPVQLERALEAFTGEVIREHVRQSEGRRELRRVIRRPEQPELGRAGRGGRRVHAVVVLAIGAPRKAVAGTLGGREREDVADVVGEAVDVARRAAHAQQLRDHRVAARRTPDAEVDAPRGDRLEGRELFRHDERGVVGEHHPTRADADAPRARRRRSREDGRCRRGDSRHVVVLREPVAAVSQLVGAGGQREGSGDGLCTGLAGADGNEVENGERGSHRSRQPARLSRHSPPA